MEIIISVIGSIPIMHIMKERGVGGPLNKIK